MPALSDDMYCAQQISVPPTFPYILRQYAKAAIRTQPSDLLKWSTAYFRCLALNLPGPVKPRLEYPIPLDYHGMTPGWLKALVLQFPFTEKVSFRLLWDRWVGACLKHEILIQILLLGRFSDNKAIHWLRFVGLCIGHLCENLTSTMIMVCEVLTEEPEGGSAMMPVEVFMDIYRFLADIDASQAQLLPNLYFTDDDLGLWEKDKSAKEVTPPETVPSEIEFVEEATAVREEESVVDEEDLRTVVSCPDITAEEKTGEAFEETKFQAQGIEVLPDAADGLAAYEEAQSQDIIKYLSAEIAGEVSEEGQYIPPEVRAQMEEERRLLLAQGMVTPASGASGTTTGESGISNPSGASGVSDSVGTPDNDDTEVEGMTLKTSLEGIPEEEVDPLRSVDTVVDDTRFKRENLVTPVEDETAITEEQSTVAPMEEEEMPVEEEAIYEDMANLEQEQHAAEEEEVSILVPEESETESSRGGEEQRVEMIEVPAVPGIGPRVPQELVEIVDEYMHKIARIQHGVVMPRNVRHFNCPPLEIFD